MDAPENCPVGGVDLSESQVRRPSRGFEGSAEDVVASWVSDARGSSAASAGAEVICLTCGYEGPLSEAPGGDRALCPACGTPWQDAGGVLRGITCDNCGRVIPLTEEHRGRTILCPGCHSFLGCLLAHDRHRGRRCPASQPAGGSDLLQVLTLISTTAVGLAAMLSLSAERNAGLVDPGTSVFVLPICWGITLLRILESRPRRGRRFAPPGYAACLAVSVGSLINLSASWDAIITYTGSRSLFLSMMLRAASPVPLAATVAAVWVLLYLNGGRKLAAGWIDLAGRVFGAYWLVFGLALPFVRYFLA